MKFFKNFKEKEGDRRLVSNIFYLSVLQGTNYILPLITFPYIVSTIGVDKFGVISFATSFIMILKIFTDYGFNLTGSREVSIHRNNIEKLTEIVNTILCIKFIFTLISFVVVLVFTTYIEKFEKDAFVFFAAFGIIVGESIFPIWFFQGMERMKYITYLNIGAKIIFSLSVFIFIHYPSDYYKVPMLSSAGFIFVGIYSLFLLRKNFHISYHVAKISTIKRYLYDGWHIFLSAIFTNTYSNTFVFLLGFFASDKAVGIYSIIEKIVGIFNSLFAPVTQSFYPYVVNKIKHNKQEAIIYLKKITLGYTLFSLLISVFIGLLSYYLLLYIGGDKMIAEEYNNYLKIMAFGIVFSRVGEVFGTFTLIGFGYNKIFSMTVMKGAFLSVVVSLLFIGLWKLEGAISSYILSNIIILAMLYTQANKIWKEFN